jgi:hypothetical protein
MSTVTGYWRSWGSGHCNAYLNTNFFAEHSTLCLLTSGFTRQVVLATCTIHQCPLCMITRLCTCIGYNQLRPQITTISLFRASSYSAFILLSRALLLRLVQIDRPCFSLLYAEVSYTTLLCHVDPLLYHNLADPDTLILTDILQFRILICSISHKTPMTTSICTIIIHHPTDTTQQTQKV